MGLVESPWIWLPNRSGRRWQQWRGIAEGTMGSRVA
jgi:hypothetical protein